MNIGVIHDTIVALIKYLFIPLPSTMTSFMYRLTASEAITKKVTSMKYCNRAETVAHSHGTELLWIAKIKKK